MSDMEKKLIAGIWFYGLIKKAKLNSKLASNLIQNANGLFNLFEMSTKSILEEIKGPPEKINKAKNYLKEKDNKSNAKRLGQIQFREGMRLIAIDDSIYPFRLKNIACPPAMLFYKGENIHKILQKEIFVSVVGTRNPTNYGQAVTKKFVSDLALRGAVIISGMARGIDSLAHNVCLDYDGYTIAVLGCGIDIVYPPENKELMDKIAKKGIVLSEYPPGTSPRREHFPARNRLISGLCDTLTIMEAAKKSGTMITAGFAGEQGKDLFAVPGSIFSPESQGTNQLIQDGACVLSDVDDMLWRFPLRTGNYELVDKDKKHKESKIIEKNDLLRKILLYNEKTIDEIAKELDIPIDKALEIIAIKEMEGTIIQTNGRISLTESYK